MRPPQYYFFDRTFLGDAWAENVRLGVNESGVIQSLECNAAQKAGDQRFGTVIPGVPNVHSHAFQRAMAGLTEYKVSAADSFWTWRQTMYRFANMISPEDLRHIASYLYIEMVKMGYTSVAEFHYLHHQEGGEQYDRIGELSFSILDAANTAGINVTLLPVLYNASGFGNKPLLPEQKRFGNSIASYFELLSNIKSEFAKHAQHAVGMALHSLRAVPPGQIKDAIAEFSAIDSSAPIHIHIAEQEQEVAQSLEWLGKRPVEWLLQNHNIDDQWCLVHATHMSGEETSALAKSGAVAGICPTTEANLGDGVFSLGQYLDAGGLIAVGSDGNTSTSPIEELRWLEYVQRLNSRGRNLVTDASNLHTGSNLFARCLRGGSKALGQRIGCIKEGYRADLLVVDDQSADLANVPMEFVLDSLLFSGNQPLIKDVMVAGKWCVRNFRHVREDEVKQNFIDATKRLREMT